MRLLTHLITSLCLASLLGGCSTLRTSTGLVSHVICSQTFVSGQPSAQAYAENIRPIPAIGTLSRAMRVQVDAETREVRTTFAGGFASSARYREGQGCTNVHGPLPDEGAPAAIRSASFTPEQLPAIAGPDLIQSPNPGLVAALDHAFTEPAKPPFRHTKAVVVLHGGSVIAERYAPGVTMNTPLIGWSAFKSVTNAFIGLLVQDGRLQLHAPAPVPEWAATSDPRHGITLEYLMRQTSGLDADEGLGTLRMQFLERDMGASAATLPRRYATGEHWAYMSGNYLLLSRIIRDQVGGNTAAVLRFAHSRLCRPLGMEHVTLEFDASGSPAYMLASARDWARFGQLYLNDGMAGSQRLLPEGWADFSASPTANVDGYGAGFWTNRGLGPLEEARVQAGMPRDAYYANGVLGQYVIVVPSENLVVVRLGASEEWTDFDVKGVSRLVGEVIAALHGQRPPEAP